MSDWEFPLEDSLDEVLSSVPCVQKKNSEIGVIPVVYADENCEIICQYIQTKILR